MAWFIGQSMVIIAAAFALGVLVGWLLWGVLRRQHRMDEPAAIAVVPQPPVMAVVPQSPAPPVMAVVPQPPVMAVVPQQADEEDLPIDDLERIEGIGPQMSKALLQAGIRTYVQLAACDEKVLRQAIEARGLRFAPSIVTWGKQAQLLADGDEDGFADLTRRLVAGRDEGRK